MGKLQIDTCALHRDKAGSMRGINLKLLLLMISIFILSVVSVRAECAQRDGKIDVFVSILPQVCFAERVGGDRVDVHVMVEPGRSPHTFEPTPKQMVELASADMYFKIGLPFESALLAKISGMDGRIRIVDTTSGIKRRMIASDNHGHGHDGEGVADPHVWLKPYNAGLMARAMAKTLGELDPKNARYYKQNAKSFEDDLAQLTRRISQRLKPYARRSFYIYHPSFGYFADAFGIVQVPIESDGKEPGANELVGIIKSARAHGASTIFVEPEFSRAKARMVARAIDGNVVVLDPLAKDYIANMELVTQKLVKALTVEK